MIYRNLWAFGFAAVSLSTLAFGTTGCSYDEAQQYCTHGDPARPGGGGFSGPALDGCIAGAHEVGPAHGSVAEADADCDQRYNVAAVPYEGNSRWSDDVTAVIESRNGCHYGAKGHLRFNTERGLMGRLDSGCVQRLEADGHVSCEPDAGTD